MSNSLKRECLISQGLSSENRELSEIFFVPEFGPPDRHHIILIG
jgi:hypothetical protein